MTFKSDKQRKAVMAKMSASFPRTTIRPGIVSSRITPVLTPSQRQFIADEIRRQRKEGRSQSQSIAIAFSKARKKFPKKAERLKVMGNPNSNLSQKKIRNLLVLLFGTAVALSILKQARN